MSDTNEFDAGISEGGFDISESYVDASDITNGADATQVLRDVIDQARDEEGCFPKVIEFDGEIFNGREGFCGTEFYDANIKNIFFKLSHKGDSMWVLEGGIHFVDPNQSTILIETLCRDGKDCDPEEATTPFADIMLGELQILPVGNLVVQVEPGAEPGIISIRAMEGSGELQIMYNESLIGTVPAPAPAQVSAGIENVGTFNTETLTLEVNEAVKADIPMIDESIPSPVKHLPGRTSAITGCNVNHSAKAPMHEPVAIMAAILFLLARKLKRSTERIPAKLIDGTSALVSRILKTN